MLYQAVFFKCTFQYTRIYKLLQVLKELCWYNPQLQMLQNVGKSWITDTSCYRYYLYKNSRPRCSCVSSFVTSHQQNEVSSRTRCSESHSSPMVEQALPRRNCQQGLAVTCTHPIIAQRMTCTFSSS